MSGYQTQQSQTAEASTVDIHSRAVSYTCGDCDGDVQLKRGEPIRCRNCGHRVLYKKRTNRYAWSPTHCLTSGEGGRGRKKPSNANLCVVWSSSKRDKRVGSVSIRSAGQPNSYISWHAKSMPDWWLCSVSKEFMGVRLI